MEHSPSWEANSSLYSLEIPFILWNLKDHYHLVEITNTVHRCITLLLLFTLTCFSHFSTNSGRFWGLWLLGNMNIQTHIPLIHQSAIWHVDMKQVIILWKHDCMKQLQVLCQKHVDKSMITKINSFLYQ